MVPWLRYAIEYVSGTLMCGMFVILCFESISNVLSTIKYFNSLDESTSAITKSLHILSSSAILSFTLSSSLGVSIACMVLFTDDVSMKIIISLRKFDIAFYELAQCITLIMFTIKSYVFFKYTMSNCIIYALYLLAIFFVIFSFFSFFIIIAKQSAYYIWSLTAVWLFLYALLSIILMVIFAKKIECLLFDHHTRNKHQEPDTIQQVQVQSHDQRKNVNINEHIKFIVIKHGLLVKIIIFSSIILFATGSVIGSQLDDLEDEEECLILELFWFVLDNTINSTCIYLLPEENTTCYIKLCKGLHRKYERYKSQKIDKRHGIEMSKINRMEANKENEVENHWYDRNEDYEKVSILDKSARSFCIRCVVFGAIFLCKVCVLFYVLVVLIQNS